MTCLHRWRCQQRIDQGLISGVSDVDRSELAAAKPRINHLEEEVTILRKATAALEGLEGVVPPKSVSVSSRNWRMKEYGCAGRAIAWVLFLEGSLNGVYGHRPRGQYVTPG